MSIRDYFLPWDQIKLVHKLWSVRIAFLGAVLDGLWVSVPVFQEYVSPLGFVLISVGLSLALVIARITNQSGIEF